MQKIVINVGKGPFSLSGKAFVEYIRCRDELGLDTGASGSLPDYIIIDDLKSIIRRDDPFLIEIVEEMGKDANGFNSDLQIIELPDGVNWEIRDIHKHEHIIFKTRDYNEVFDSLSIEKGSKEKDMQKKMVRVVINTKESYFSLSEQGFLKYMAYSIGIKEEVFCKLNDTLNMGNHVVKRIFDTIKRDDPNLVRVVEEIGENANGRDTDLKIVYIPYGTKWKVDDDHCKEKLIIG